VRTIRLLIEYDGTGYAGWQVQPDQETIQGRLEAALERITGEPIRVVSSGRTDAGVHALGQVAHFTTHSAMSPEEFRRALNGVLPRDIAVREASDAPEGFHARYSARRKRYRYVIIQGETRSAFGHRYGWEVGYRLDVAAMRQAAKQLVGTHDFSAFRATGGSAADPVRTLHLLDVEEQGTEVVILAEAEGFLRHMVRILVGTLVEVGRGRLAPDEVQAILESRDRSLAGPTAPPQGLFLLEVTY
jgi:tRNA pseudouridine38-40 synthase